MSTSLCSACGRPDDDLRFGCCFECASSGEERAAKRSVLQHLAVAIYRAFWIRRWGSGFHWYTVKTEFKWAWERLTRTGDYAEGGTFDWEGYDWR